MSQDPTDTAEKESENEKLRQLLWINHALNVKEDGHNLYGDDGEMQCSGIDGYCDFKRDKVSDIEKHIVNRALRLIYEKPELVSKITHLIKKG